jgi:hypothetical protein
MLAVLLERICHPSLWEVVANRIQRAGGPAVSGSSVLRVQVQELTPGLVDAVAITDLLCSGSRSPLEAGPTSSASISVTDRLSPSGVSQLRWRSRPLTMSPAWPGHR